MFSTRSGLRPRAPARRRRSGLRGDGRTARDQDAPAPLIARRNRKGGRQRRMRSPISAPTSSVRQTEDRAVAERLWKNEGAMGRKRFDGFKPETASTRQISLPPPATGCPQSRMVSSGGGASGRRRGGVRMPAPDRSTPASPWCCEPVGRYGAGACGAVDCCLEREPQSRTWRPLRSGVSCRLGKEARDGRRR
jgi:hypothetical protein